MCMCRLRRGNNKQGHFLFLKQGPIYPNSPAEFPEFMLVWDRKLNLSDQHFNVITVCVREIYTEIKKTEIKEELEVHESSIFIVY